jgi:predicted nuclease with TOPRIM domain
MKKKTSDKKTTPPAGDSNASATDDARISIATMLDKLIHDQTHSEPPVSKEQVLSALKNFVIELRTDPLSRTKEQIAEFLAQLLQNFMKKLLTASDVNLIQQALLLDLLTPDAVVLTPPLCNTIVMLQDTIEEQQEKMRKLQEKMRELEQENACLTNQISLLTEPPKPQKNTRKSANSKQPKPELPNPEVTIKTPGETPDEQPAELTIIGAHNNLLNCTKAIVEIKQRDVKNRHSKCVERINDFATQENAILTEMQTATRDKKKPLAAKWLELVSQKESAEDELAEIMATVAVFAKFDEVCVQSLLTKFDKLIDTALSPATPPPALTTASTATAAPTPALTTASMATAASTPALTTASTATAVPTPALTKTPALYTDVVQKQVQKQKQK